jgi:hypothetical protein
VDVRNATRIYCLGIPESDEMLEQKVGRGGRDSSAECLAIIFAEEWALSGDPERIRTGCAKEKRTPISLFRTLTTRICRRLMSAERNGDQTPNGRSYLRLIQDTS